MGVSEALMVFSHEYCEKATHICMYSLKGAVSPDWHGIKPSTPPMFATPLGEIN
jgi:hypothetical protein